MRKPLYTPVVENSNGPVEPQAKRVFSVGSVAFPNLSNPSGHVLDRLKRQGKRR
jgi:hypothetical protein